MEGCSKDILNIYKEATTKKNHFLFHSIFNIVINLQCNIFSSKAYSFQSFKIYGILQEFLDGFNYTKFTTYN